MSFELVITDAAFFDIRQSLRWLSERNRAAALRWHASLLAHVRSLAENPERCPLATEDELANLAIRELWHGKRSRMHRILYRIQGEVVQILRFRHASQDQLSVEDVGLSEPDG